MRLSRPAFALLLPLLLLAAGPAKDGAGDAERLKGIWAATSIKVGGRNRPDDPTRGGVMYAFDGESYVHRVGERIASEGDYELDTAKGPGAIDLVILKGPHAGERQLGRYKVSGDTLILCVAPPGVESRPKGFESGSRSSDDELVVCKRFRP